MIDIHDMKYREKMTATFWRFTDKRGPDDCWPWKGAVTRREHGRGQMNVGDSRHVNAARACVVIHGQTIPPGMFVCHRCDNPNCVNPAHLFIGSNRDNLRDAAIKGRLPGQKKTHCLRGHPLSGDNVIRQRKLTGRACKTCQRESSRRSDAKRRGDTPEPT